MQNGKTILIAEDDMGNYVLTRRCIRNSGIENKMVWLQDGRLLLDYLNECINNGQKDFHDFVLLLDLNMPKIGGIEVLKRVKQDRKLKDIYVIVLSSSSSIYDIENCFDHSCDDYVVKPADHRLIEAMKNISVLLN